MRVVFFGSGSFGIPTLRALAAGGEDIAGVYTRPARPAGRRGKITPTPLALAAEELSIPVNAVEDVNSPQCVAEINRLAPDVLLVIDFGQKIGPQVRQAPRLGAINLHGSLLPELRGAAPVNWAIIRGFDRTGVTVIELAERMDAGGIFSRRRTEVRPSETADQLRLRLAEIGVEAVSETLEMLAAGRARSCPQDESLATTARRLKKSDGRLDLAADAVSVRNLIHGVWPWPGGQARYVSAGGKSTDVVIAAAAAAETGRPGTPGVVGEDLTVECGRGRLKIIRIKPAGRRLMDWRDFVNGYGVAAGARFEKKTR